MEINEKIYILHSAFPQTQISKILKKDPEFFKKEYTISQNNGFGDLIVKELPTYGFHWSNVIPVKYAIVSENGIISSIAHKDINTMSLEEIQDFDEDYLVGMFYSIWELKLINYFNFRIISNDFLYNEHKKLIVENFSSEFDIKYQNNKIKKEYMIKSKILHLQIIKNVNFLNDFYDIENRLHKYLQTLYNSIQSELIYRRSKHLLFLKDNSVENLKEFEKKLEVTIQNDYLLELKNLQTFNDDVLKTIKTKFFELKDIREQIKKNYLIQYKEDIVSINSKIIRQNIVNYLNNIKLKKEDKILFNHLKKIIENYNQSFNTEIYKNFKYFLKKYSDNEISHSLESKS